MNKSNTGEIKFRKKTRFRPIMLTSKSIKPIERSNIDRTKLEDKNDNQLNNDNNNNNNNQCTSSLKKKYSHNCALISNQITKAEMIKRLTDEYREELIKNIWKQSTSRKRSGTRSKSITPSIIQVEFQNQLSLNCSGQGRSRYEKMLSGLQSMQSHCNSQTLKKYFYCTSSSSRSGDPTMYSIKNKITQNNTSLAFRQINSKPKCRQTEEWNNFLQKYYLNIKKISPESKSQAIGAKVSEEKLEEISMKVQEYQNSLIKKMQERFKVFPAYQEEESPELRCQSPEARSKPNNFMGDLQKIQEDIQTKRQGSKKEHFVFSMSETTKINVEQLSRQKFENYKDFLWKINFGNGLYVRLKDEIEPQYKLFVGPGNNSMLIRGIMRRRFWWQVVEKSSEDTNFIWTQIKINQFFKLQTKNVSRQNHQNRNQNRHQAAILKNRYAFSALQKTARAQSKSRRKNAPQRQQQDQTQNQPISQEVDGNSKIFNQRDYNLWLNHYKINKKYEQKSEIVYAKRIKTMVRKKQLSYIEDSRKLKVQNHFQANYYLGNKKALFYSMRKYYNLLGKDPFQHIPLTFHISKGLDDPQYAKFLQKFEQFQLKKKNKQLQNIWIVKPGEMTNRGRGITVCSTLDQIKIRLKSKQKAKNGQPHTYIVQKYIQKPLLYNRRKFDIRHYMLMTCTNGKFKGYWYEEGYLRTTSYEYNIKNCKDLYTHLTNDAIQKYASDYGKFQKGNKLSYGDFQKYLNANFRGKGQKDKDKGEVDKYDFFGNILPQMRNLAADAMRATYLSLSPKRYQHNFQLFGLDFMLDQQMKVYLIEVNTNPCLQTSSPLLSRLIPPVIENTFKLTIDPLFPPPYEWPAQKKMQMGENCLEESRYMLIFDEEEEGDELRRMFGEEMGMDIIGGIQEEEEFYEDQGKEWVQEV